MSFKNTCRNNTIFINSFNNSLSDLNSELFRSILKEGKTLPELIALYGNKKFQLRDKSFTTRYIKRLFYKFKNNEESKARKAGYDLKYTTPEEVMLSRFILNGTYTAYLPQIKIAGLLEVNQKTISRYIAKMIEKGLIKLDKKFAHYERMASIYSLTTAGLEKIKTMTFGYRYDKIFAKMFMHLESKKDNVPTEIETKAQIDSNTQLYYNISKSFKKFSFEEPKRFHGSISLYQTIGGFKNAR